MEKYLFRESKSDYVNWFEQEKGRLLEAFGPLAIIEHIGSTAIPGLGGKGILDIMIGLEGDIEILKEIFSSIGYEHVGSAGSQYRMFFFRDVERNNQMNRIHAHFVNKTSPEWRNALAFRDHLRKNPKLTKEYAAIKQSAVEFASGDGKKYQQFKYAFIQKILKSTTSNQ